MSSFTRAHITQLMTLIGVFLSSSFVLGAEVNSVRQLVLDSGITGGLIVDVGAASAQEIAALRINDRFLVQGLQRVSARVSEAREGLQRMGLLGPVTAIHWRGKHLPYADNMVNLIVLRDTRYGIRDEELMRVLAPGGVLLKTSPDTRHPKPASASLGLTTSTSGRIFCTAPTTTRWPRIRESRRPITCNGWLIRDGGEVTTIWPA